MIGNYPVNDDWIFVRQVEAFNQGIFKLSAELDPSFVAQGFLGLLWGKVFGISFLSLQILTTLVTLVGIYYLVKILELLEVEKKFIVLISLLYFFNPIVFNSTFSFMTDNYFLTFMLISCFYYLKLLKDGKMSNLLFASSFMLLTSLVRQIGVFIGLAYVLSVALRGFRQIRKEYKNIIMSLFFVCLGVFLSFLWSDYGSNRMFILPEQFLFRFKQWLLSFYYIPLFVFPLFYSLKLKKESLIVKVVVFIVAVGLGLVLYRYDVFPLGNVLYLEELHAKSDFRFNFSLIDNIFFKIGISGLIALALVRFIFYMVGSLLDKKIKFDKVDIFLIWLLVLNLGVLLISSDFYDRYLIPSLVTYLFIFAKNCLRSYEINWKVIGGTLLIAVISIFLQWEFSTKTRIKWEQASLISEQTGYLKQIDINDVYRKYTATVKAGDYTGLADTRVFEKKCYVQEYTIDPVNQIFTKVQQIEKKLDKKFLQKNKPPHVNKREIPRVKNNLDILMYKQEYFSPLYNLVGKKAYVGSWCLE